jgi:hypothetical protein
MLSLASDRGSAIDPARLALKRKPFQITEINAMLATKVVFA